MRRLIPCQDFLLFELPTTYALIIFTFFHFQVVTCGPNEALIISGVFHGNEPTMIVGGRALVFPMVQTIQKLPLSTMTLVVQSPKVYTSQGVPISVTGVAQVSLIKIKLFSTFLGKHAEKSFSPIGCEIIDK